MSRDSENQDEAVSADEGPRGEPLKVVEVNILEGHASITKINHGDEIIGRSFCAVVYGKFPCADSSYYNDDAPGCDWCQSLINRIKSRRIF